MKIRIPIKSPVSLLVWWQPGMLKKPTNLRHDSPGGGDPLQCFGGTARGVAGQCPTKLSSLWGWWVELKVFIFAPSSSASSTNRPSQESANVYPPQMGVSKNKGTPKWMLYNGKNPIKWMIWGYPYFGNIQIEGWMGSVFCGWFLLDL